MTRSSTSLYLHASLSAWGEAGFQAMLQSELQQLDASRLPLQQGLTQGSYASDDNLSVIILSVNDDHAAIHAKAGIFYTGVIPGCHCADDPGPNNEVNEYCEVWVHIDKYTAACKIEPLD